MHEKTIAWDDLQIFLAVAREGGLSSAARASQKSPATIGRRMKALELALGLDLFHRHDRGYSLTRAGQALAEDLQPAENRIRRATAPLPSDQKPLVKLSAGTWTTLALLTEASSLAGSPADVQLRFMAADHRLDISRGEVAIGIRNQPPAQTNLAVRAVGDVAFAPYAHPQAPNVWIKMLGETPSARWLDRHAGNEALYEVNNPRNALDLALAGHGKVLLPTFIGDNQPGLTQCGKTIDELAHGQWVVTHQDDRHLPHVRRVLERLYKVLQHR